MARAFADLENTGGTPSATRIGGSVGKAATAYRTLTGEWPEAANIEDDATFDRHILAAIIAVASVESGDLTARTGLTEAELDRIFSDVFATRVAGEGRPCAPTPVDADEMEIVRDLLLANRSSQGDCGRWLAAMMARRALEPNHLWEDLGLRERSELTRLIARHFAPLAARNDKNMRWKRFIYRMMCEEDGLVMCASPVCSNCADHALCFGVETGTSRVLSNDEISTPPGV
jgi:nitrogen fixation protein NifQ